MAVLLAPIALGAQGGAVATALGTVGFALTSTVVVAAAAYVDARYVMPGLLGGTRGKARQDKLLGVPVGSNDPGAPRISAFGRRIRVPTHIGWQSDKLRSDSVRNTKGGAVQQRKVEISCLLMLNDRYTKRLEQLRGNDNLIIARTTNLIDVVTSEMVAVAEGANVRITTLTVDDPDFGDKFQVDDFVRLFGFMPITGSVTELHRGQWKVERVEAHSVTATSFMVLSPQSTQSVAGINASGGNSAAPARVERQDNQIAGWETVHITTVATRKRFIFAKVATPGPSNEPHYEFVDLVEENILPNLTVEVTEYQILGSGAGTFQREVKYTSTVRYTGMVNGLIPYGYGYRLPYVDIDIATMTTVISDSPPAGPGIVKSANTIRVVNPLGVALLPNGYNVDDHFYRGTEDQLPDSLMEANLGEGNVPFYRGMSYVVLDRLQVTQFGDSLPFSIDALLNVDEGLTWQEAIRLICEHGNLRREFTNTDLVDPTPFEGCYVRGSVPGLTNLMPLLIAKQLTTQDRNGVIHFMDADQSDVVPIENGALMTDFGAVVGGVNSTEPKIQWDKPSPSDLPRFVGVRHQDSDNQYASGFQSFGLRNRNATLEQNEQEINLESMAMTRKDAKNLATTLLRRAHVNATGVSYTLTAQYLDLLEGDIQTFVDETGTPRTVRVMRRDVGTNQLVKVEADLEGLNLAVTGSPVQVPIQPPVRLVVPTPVDGFVFDIPALRDEHSTSRSLYAIATSGYGTVWNGCYAYMSVDGDQTWSLIGYVSHQANVGTLTTSLAAGSPAETYGVSGVTYDASTMAVEFDNPSAVGSISSVGSGAEFGLNWFVVVAPDGRAEVVGVADVVQDDEVRFTFSNLLRGLRGTWPACLTAFPAGSRVYAVDSILSGLVIDFSSVAPPIVVSMRFVPPGLSVADVTSVAITPSWRNVSPFPLRKLVKSIGSTPYNATFETENWTRKLQQLGALPPYPMDEDVEAYRFTFYDPTGTFVRRTKTITAQQTGSTTLVNRSVTYTAAEQSADGYTPSGSTTFWVGVQQVGTYGDSQLVKKNV
jgi:hypothetical protein